MFSKILNFFYRVEAVVEHDVNAIISTFNTTIDKLEAAAVAKTAEAAEHVAASARYEQLADTAYDAAQKAKSVAEKIKALVA